MTPTWMSVASPKTCRGSAGADAPGWNASGPVAPSSTFSAVATALHVTPASLDRRSVVWYAPTFVTTYVTASVGAATHMRSVTPGTTRGSHAQWRPRSSDEHASVLPAYGQSAVYQKRPWG